MPVQLTNPGVYIQELESGSHTITGVATSITAFIGRALKGPVAKPTTIFSYAEFERTFGGEWAQSYLASTVRDFFLNGGSIAIIVRAEHSKVVGGARTLTAIAASADLDLSPLLATKVIKLRAAGPGEYGNQYYVRVTPGGADPVTGAADNSRFLLEVTAKPKLDGTEEVYERFANESVASIVSTLNTRSAIVLAEVTTTAGAGGGAVNSPVHLKDGDDGGPLTSADYTATSPDTQVRGAITALTDVGLFNLLVIPPTRPGPLAAANWTKVVAEATAVCEKRRAFLVLDAPQTWNSATVTTNTMRPDVFGAPSKDVAIFTPWMLQPDPAVEGSLIEMPVSGAVAGIFGRTESNRGVWKAPAGVEAGVRGAIGPARLLSDGDNGVLNSNGINCLMVKPNRGLVVWGSRTTVGFDGSGSQWKYVPVRRLFDLIEETLFRNTLWVVFEINDMPLWRQIKLDIKAFLNTLFRQGAFQGATATEAYYVACGWETMTQADIDNGIINIEVGFAPVKPAEFVVISFRQKINTAGIV